MRNIRLATFWAMVPVVASMFVPGTFVEAAKITKGNPYYEVLRLVQAKQATLRELDQTCQQAEKISQIVHAVSGLASPLLPALDGLAESKVLSVIGKIPIVGKPAGALQSTATALRALLRALLWVDRIDAEYEGPIREAVLKSNRLLDSQDAEDIPPLLTSYDAGCAAAVKMQANLETTRGRTGDCIVLVNRTMTVLERLGAPASGTRTSCNELLKQLYLLQSALDTMKQQVSDGQRFMQQALSAGRSPNALTGAVVGDHNRSKSLKVGAALATHPSTEPKKTGRSRPGMRTPVSPLAPRRTAALPQLGKEMPNLEAPPVPPPGSAQGPGVAEARNAADTAKTERRSGSSWILILASLPAIGALGAIGWMLARYYRARSGTSGAAPPIFSPALPAPEPLATLRIGGRQVLIPSDQPAVLGRAAGSGSIEVLDASISARHAVIEYRDGDWWLADAGSRNGTYANGQRVKETVLQDGDRLQFGDVGAVFSSIRK